MASSSPECSLYTEYQLIRENIAIQEQRLTQLYVIQSARNPFRWFGTLFIDSGIYMGAIVRMTIEIGRNYPDSPCPDLYFDPIPYHPLVDPNTGQLDTKNAFLVWDGRNKHRLYHLLAFAKRVLVSAEIYFQSIDKWFDEIYRDDESATDGIMIGGEPRPSDETNSSDVVVNNRTQDDTAIARAFLNPAHTREAIELYNTNIESFHQKASDFVYECSHRVYDFPKDNPDDEHAIIFSPWEPEIHEPLRMKILNGKQNGQQYNLYASYDKSSNSVNFVPGSSSWDCP